MVREMTETNLRSAFAGESQAHIRYKISAERAEKSGLSNVGRLFNAIALAERIHAGNHLARALETEKVHASLYKKAKQAVDQGKDVALGPIQICSTCGYTIEGDLPDKCPICGATKEKFKTF